MMIRRAAIRPLIGALPILLIVTYGALLRFEALTVRYGTVTSPSWFASLQNALRPAIASIRPTALGWRAVGTYPHADGPPTRYISDPYTYTQYAREMSSFYAAHYREPLFVASTKIYLWLLDNQDVAVSFASVTFSILTIYATYLLGAALATRWVGLLAALAFALEQTVISWSVGGWRDDAFTLFAVLFAYAAVRYSRSRSVKDVIPLGVWAAAGCLTRITSLSFIVPTVLYLAATTPGSWKARVTGPAVGMSLMTAIIAPYLINCWLTFGDPFYSLNFHTHTYLGDQARGAPRPQTAADFAAARLTGRPMRTLNVVATGMTVYPFSNKWRGFDVWIPGAGAWLSYFALAGLALMLRSGSGRVVLVVLATSMLPYAATWYLNSHWRFTQHTYPFFLVAAFFTFYAGLQAAKVVGELKADPAPLRRELAFWAGLACAVGVVAWIMLRILPVQAAKEQLASGEAVPFEAGGQGSSAYFRSGWSQPQTEGNVTSRISNGSRAEVWLPIPEQRRYRLRARLDPFPRPDESQEGESLPTMQVLVNDTAADTVPLQWNPARVGSYDLPLASSALQPGWNRLSFLVSGSENDQHRIRFWFVYVDPERSPRPRRR